MDCSQPGSSVHGILQAGILEWGCHALLQKIFLAQGLNSCLSCLLHWQSGSLSLAPPGNVTGGKEIHIPVVGIYTWHQENLRQLPHLTLARDTLHFLALRWGHIRLPASGPQDTATHFPALDTQLL